MKTYSDRYISQDRQSHKPYIKKNHIDGPLLVFSDGQMHWLTLWERVQLRFGKTNADKLQRKLRPILTVMSDT